MSYGDGCVVVATPRTGRVVMGAEPTIGLRGVDVVVGVLGKMVVVVMAVTPMIGW
jgi:hypothetical protein